MTKTHRYILTSPYTGILGSFSSRSSASDAATRERNAGGRALIHDRKTGRIIRDTGKPLGQVWGLPSRKGEKSPAFLWDDTRYRTKIEQR